MYEIWADNLLIYSDVTPLETVKVVNPKLTLADSAAGQLDMTLPPTNIGYSLIKRMTTNIVIKENGEWLWSGRVLQDTYDFWNNRKMVCEGEIAFLNDSIQPPAKYDVTHDHTTIRSFFEALINIHNGQVDDDRRFVVGDVTVIDGDMQDDNDSIYRFTNYETTLQCINDKLLNRLKGHLRVRHEIQNGVEVRILDYIADGSLSTNSQIVRFGVNLLDFSKNIDMAQLSTAIVPRGKRLEEESAIEVEGLEPYLTVKSLGDKYETNPDTGQVELWHESGDIFVKNQTAVNNFGWIAAVVDWDQVTDADNLYNKAVKYLKDEQYEKMTLEVKALDLKYLEVDAQTIKFLSKLRCLSEPHGMDHTFIVSKMDLDLQNPGNSVYTLGSDIRLSLTQAASRVNSEVQSQIDNLPSKSEILTAAQRNAYKMISGADNSYVHFIPGMVDGVTKGIQRIEVTDGPTYIAENDRDDDPLTDPFPDSLNRWIWTVGGLGHIGRHNYNETWQSIGLMNVAMTMDGAIVANLITTGTLQAQNGNYILDMTTGYVKMLNGEFTGKLSSSEGAIGPWHIKASGFTNNDNAWLAPYDISCGKYGGTLIGMRGKGSGNSGGYLEVGVNAGNDYIHVFVNSIEKKNNGGTSYAEWNNGSDERIKKDINDLSLEEALLIINNTEPLTFRYKDNDRIKYYGFTAQRIKAECEKIGIDEPFIRYGEMSGDLMNVDYTQFIAPLLKVVQQQQKDIEELKKK